MKRLIGGLICLAILLPAAVRGEVPLGDPSSWTVGRQVEIYADQMQRRTEEKMLIAEGAVDIRSGQLRLRADRVELHVETMDLVATGNVILESGVERLQGEYMEFNLETELGYFTEAQGSAQAYFFAGERIDKISENQYLVRKGSFTSCEGVIPDWSFKTPRARIHVDNYIYARHPTMWVKRLPVLYLPYTIVPIKRDRATGFLIPGIGVNNRDGFVIKNAFYWVQADNADATFYIQYFARRGWRFGLEERYILGEETEGRLAAFYIDDKGTDSRRWEVDYIHRQKLPWGFYGLVNFDFLSDTDYKREFDENLEDLSQEKINSFASITREWEDTTLILSAEYDENLTSIRENTLTRFPEIIVKQKEGPIGSWPLHWSMRAQGVGLRQRIEDEVTETGRFDLFPVLSLPVNIQSWANIKPSFGMDYTYYTKDLDDDAASRLLFNPRVDVTGPRLYRIFGIEDKLPRFKHLLIPELNYNFLSVGDQENLPRFDSVDRKSEDNSLTYGLTNRILGKFAVEDGEPITREVLRLKIAQTYDFDPPELRGDKKYLGDLILDLESYLHEDLFLYSDIAYDFEENLFASVNYGFVWDYKDILDLSLERRHSDRSRVDYLEWLVGIKPGKWDFSYRGRYDLEDSSFVEHYSQVSYTAQCWDFTFTMVKREDFTDYRFTLNLKEIGTIIRF